MSHTVVSGKREREREAGLPLHKNARNALAHTTAEAYTRTHPLSHSQTRKIPLCKCSIYQNIEFSSQLLAYGISLSPPPPKKRLLAIFHIIHYIVADWLEGER